MLDEENECHALQEPSLLVLCAEEWYCRAKEEVEVKACSASVQR